MGTVSGACRSLAAAGGFLAGYLWAVVSWARGVGMASGPAEMGVCVAGGAFLSVLHAVLVAAFLWPEQTASRATGLRVVVAPAAFTLSFLVGAFGIRLALKVIG